MTLHISSSALFKNSLRSIASRVGIEIVENVFPTDFWTECSRCGFFVGLVWSDAWERFLADEVDGVGSDEVGGSTVTVFMANIAWSAVSKLLDSSILKQWNYI